MAKREKNIREILGAAAVHVGRNLKWALEHPELLERYAGRYVAIDKRRVIAVADDVATLHKRFSKRPEVLVHYVYPPGRGRLLLVAAA
jgi:uncharacterized protein DUF5678